MMKLRRFYNNLTSSGYTGVYCVGDNLAWESDFEQPQTGNEIADTVDMIYFVGHGSPNRFWFGINTDLDGIYCYRVYVSEARWGDNDLEWIVISACRSLNETYVDNWRQVFVGLHGICGYNSVSYEGATLSRALGEEFARLIAEGYSVGYAWRYATERYQPSGVWAAIYRIVVRLDSNIVDYYYEVFGESWPDVSYNDPLLYAIRYTTWLCGGG